MHFDRCFAFASGNALVSTGALVSKAWRDLIVGASASRRGAAARWEAVLHGLVPVSDSMVGGRTAGVQVVAGAASGAASSSDVGGAGGDGAARDGVGGKARAAANAGGEDLVQALYDFFLVAAPGAILQRIRGIRAGHTHMHTRARAHTQRLRVGQTEEAWALIAHTHRERKWDSQKSHGALIAHTHRFTRTHTLRALNAIA